MSESITIQNYHQNKVGPWTKHRGPPHQIVEELLVLFCFLKERKSRYYIKFVVFDVVTFPPGVIGDIVLHL